MFVLRLFFFILAVAVVFAFFLCWAPFHAQRIHAFYFQDHVFIYAIMTYISGVLYYLSTCINPLLYNIMSNKFREAFKVCKFNRFLSRLAQNSNRLLSYCILNELNELNGILNVCAFARSLVCSANICK